MSDKKRAELKKRKSIGQEETPRPSGITFLSVEHNTHVDIDFNWTSGTTDVSQAFKFEKRLGKGAFGEVWRAKHTQTSIVMAVKKISIKLGEAEKDVKNEIEVLKKCKHINIVSYFGAVAGVKGELWVLMDYCSLGSVLHLVTTRGPVSLMPMKEVYMQCVMSNVVKGLHYLHSKNIIHRDIKCGNILLSEAGVPKIADFGLSFQSGTTVQASGSALWIPPELLTAEEEEVQATAVCDVWSLGISLIEMAQDGKPPHWEVNNLMRSMFLIGTSDPPDFKEPQKWSAGCNGFLKKCLIKDPTQRTPSKDLLADSWIVTAPDARQVFSHIVANFKDQERFEEYGNQMWTISCSYKNEQMTTRMKPNLSVEELTYKLKARLTQEAFDSQVLGLFSDTLNNFLEFDLKLYNYANLVDKGTLKLILRTKPMDQIIQDYQKFQHLLKVRDDTIQFLTEENEQLKQKKQ